MNDVPLNKKIMATQRCPKCKSDRVRLGYRSTPMLLKLLFRYNLLCDQCNWEFSGFAIPGTVSGKTKKKRGTENLVVTSPIVLPHSEIHDEEGTSDSEDLKSFSDTGEFDITEPLEAAEVSQRPKNLALVRKKRVRIKLHGS